MSVNLERVEGFAELFHHYYQALAPDFECSAGDKGDKPEWHDLGLNERRRFVAATRLALMEAGSQPDDHPSGNEGRRFGSEGRECGC
jgi:hypothetical protein